MLSGKTESISREVENIISDFSNLLFVSSLSIVETILLIKTNKIEIVCKVEDLIDFVEEKFYIQILQTKEQHLKTYSKLKLADNHKDQTDHFIISQAICEKMTLVSSDRRFREYISQHLEFVYNKR